LSFFHRAHRIARNGARANRARPPNHFTTAADRAAISEFRIPAAENDFLAFFDLLAVIWVLNIDESERRRRRCRSKMDVYILPA